MKNNNNNKFYCYYFLIFLIISIECLNLSSLCLANKHHKNDNDNEISITENAQSLKKSYNNNNNELLIQNQNQKSFEKKQEKSSSKKEQEKKIDDLYCSSVSQCPKESCQNVDCINQRCVYSEVICDLPANFENPCVMNGVCDPSSGGYCKYQTLNCDDNDPCTIDQCIPQLLNDNGNNGEARFQTSICSNTPIKGCINKYAHTTDIEIVEHSNVDIQTFYDPITNEQVYQICAISTYPDLQDSAVIVGFEPYTPCTLDQPGSCDTHSVIENNPTEYKAHSGYCIKDSTPILSIDEESGVFVDEVGSSKERYILSLPGFSNTLLLLPKSPNHRFILDSESGTAQLFGSVYDPNNLLVSRLDFEFKFDGYSDLITPDFQDFMDFVESGITESINDMTDEEIAIETDNGDYEKLQNFKKNMEKNNDVLLSWKKMNLIQGRITAQVGTPLEGLIIETYNYNNNNGFGDSETIVMMGPGANSKNLNNGLYAKFAWKVVQQPFHSYYNIPSPSFVSKLSTTKNNGVDFAELTVDLYQLDDGSCDTTIGYCDYFNGAKKKNDWSSSSSNFNNVLSYCRNFTLEDLLSCRPSSSSLSPSSSSLFEITNLLDNDCEETDSCAIRYDGKLYHTFIKNNECLMNNQNNNENDLSLLLSDNDNMNTCSEIIQTIEHNISFTLNVNGMSQVTFVRNNKYNFDVLWTGNVWLAGEENGGNLRITLMTFIDYEKGTFLCNPRILDSSSSNNQQSTTFEFDPNTIIACLMNPNGNDIVNPNVDTTNDGNYSCYQDWAIQSINANDQTDFSSLQSLVWSVCKYNQSTVEFVFDYVNDTQQSDEKRENDEDEDKEEKSITVTAIPEINYEDIFIELGDVFANINFVAMHNDGPQFHKDGQLSATTSLFYDSEFSSPYDFERLIDNQDMFASVCLDNHKHLDILLRDVSFCFSTERDLIPYDPAAPYKTGCNTPGNDVQEVLIYSHDAIKELTIDGSVHQFNFILPQQSLSSFSPSPLTFECDKFTFKVSAYSSFAQILKVRWAAQEIGGHGAVVEMISEFNTRHSSDVSRHLEHDDEDESFLVDCPFDDWTFDWDSHHCRHRDMDDNWVFWTFFWIVFAVLIIGLCCCVHYHMPPPRSLSSLEANLTPTTSFVPSTTFQQQQQYDNNGYGYPYPPPSSTPQSQYYPTQNPNVYTSSSSSSSSYYPSQQQYQYQYQSPVVSNNNMQFV